VNDVTRRRIANNGAILSDAMNTIPSDVVSMHRRLGEADDAPRDREHRDGDGLFCELHQRGLAQCHAALERNDLRHPKTAQLMDGPCHGIPNRGDNNDPTGEAAINSAGAHLAAERRQDRHDDWLLRYRDVCDEGLRMGYGRAINPTHKEERLVDGTGCPIDCCPNCWLDTRKDGSHVEKSIERDAPGGSHAAVSKTTGRKVCGPCCKYEDDYGHLPPAAVLKMMRASGRRPGLPHLLRLDPKLAKNTGRESVSV
jgi:hypothetical protein